MSLNKKNNDKLIESLDNLQETLNSINQNIIELNKNILDSKVNDETKIIDNFNYMDTDKIVNICLRKRNIDAEKLRKTSRSLYAFLVDFANSYSIDENCKNDNDKLGWERGIRVGKIIDMIIKSNYFSDPEFSLNRYAIEGRKVKLLSDGKDYAKGYFTLVDHTAV